MSLSSPVARKSVHTRTMEIDGYVREDGLWDIEGRLTDVKPYSFPNKDRGRIDAGEPLHDMLVRLTVDDQFEIKMIEVAMDSTPYALCPQITPNFQALVGRRIGPGWRRKLKDVLGGIRGCTHVVELLGAMATVAYQSTYSSEKVTGKVHSKNPGIAAKFLVNSCHAYRADGPVIEDQFPDHYTGDRKT